MCPIRLLVKTIWSLLKERVFSMGSSREPWISWSLFLSYSSHRSYRSLFTCLLIYDLISFGDTGDLIEISPLKVCFANLSTNSLPLIFTWLEIQQKITSTPVLSQPTQYSVDLGNITVISWSDRRFQSASRQDLASVKIMKFFYSSSFIHQSGSNKA